MRLWLRRSLLVIASALLILALVIGINTARFAPSSTPAATPSAPAIDAAAVERMAGAVRIPTVSNEGGRYDAAKFDALHAKLARDFPRVHATLRRELVAGHTLLYTWTGRDPSLRPVLLAAHQDVVPVEPGTEGDWTHPAFSGVVADGFLWGRGTMDDKVAVMAILEAVEAKLARGEMPARTVYLAFGHDEEVSGSGAQAVAALLKARGVRLDLVLDEGLSVTQGLLPGITRPVALIGAAEKGYVSVELTAHGAGGHSSMPTGDNAVVTLARAIDRIAENPFPARLDGPVGTMLDRTGPHMGLAMRAVLANRWLTEPMVVGRLVESPRTAASVRTTTAPTMLDAGTKANVLPQAARAVVNHRILPGDTVESVVAHDRAAVDDDKVTVRALPGGRGPSRVSPLDGPALAAVERAIGRTFPDAIVAPALTVAGTDARNYEPVADAIYRFSPIRTGPADLARLHGTDERVAVADYMRAIAFYGAMIDEAGRIGAAR